MSLVKSCIFCPHVPTSFTKPQGSDDSIKKTINFVTKILDVGDHLLGDVKNLGTTGFCSECALIVSQVGEIYGKLAPLIDKIQQNLKSKEGQVLIKEENEESEEIAVKCERHIQNILEDDDYPQDGEGDDAEWSQLRIVDQKEDEDDDDEGELGRDPLENDVNPSSRGSSRCSSPGPIPTKKIKIAFAATQSHYPLLRSGVCNICGEKSKDLFYHRGVKNHDLAHELEVYQNNQEPSPLWSARRHCPLSLKCQYSTTNPAYM